MAEGLKRIEGWSVFAWEAPF